MSTVSLLVHGAGSCPATALAMLGTAVAPGSRPDAIAARGRVEDVAELIATTVEEHRRRGTTVVRLAGISLGAHAAVLWAASSGTTTELALVMPAWSGAPDAVAAATLGAADEVARLGSRTVLDRLRADPATTGDWVLEELVRGWTTYDDAALVATLRAAGASRGPSRDELAAVLAASAVVALADDPLHPEAVAREWAATMPRARLAVVERRAPVSDRAALGTAAAAMLSDLSGSR